jgi:hypothetical protein
MIVIIYDCHIFLVQAPEKIPKLKIINFSNFLVSACRKDSNLNAFLTTFTSYSGHFSRYADRHQ